MHRWSLLDYFVLNYLSEDYFGIIFDKNSQENRWVMGKIFLRKYPVIFSPINKYIRNKL